MADGITIKANWDWAEAKALMRKLSGPKLHQAMSVAVNDSARQVERKAEQLVAKSLSIPAKRSKMGIWVRPYSTPSTLTAVVRGSGSIIPLKAFKAREEGDGVSATLWGRRIHHPGAFIYGGALGAHNKELGMGGHVFTRLGPSRLPIKRAKGAAIAEAMAKDAVSGANEAYGVERLQANVLRQLTRYASTKKAASTKRNGEGKFKPKSQR
jgi:hypothetical protein